MPPVLVAIGLVTSLAAVLGCEGRGDSCAPSAEISKRAVEFLLPGLQFGADPQLETFREVRAVEIAGAHFVPLENHWRIHYCAEYTNLASDAPQRRCDRNVRVYELDSKKWVGFAAGAGTLYRWQVIEDAAKKDGDGGVAGAPPREPNAAQAAP